MLKKKSEQSNTRLQFKQSKKNEEYIYHLWQNIYSSICTKTLPCPWPSPKTGLPATQYNFKSRASPSLTLLHSQWYEWSIPKKHLLKLSH